jgi:transposase-like protein
VGTSLLANAVMNDIMTQQDTDNAEKPPPCPWCHVASVREITTPNAEDARWFHCQSCSRAFSIRFEPATAAT